MRNAVLALLSLSLCLALAVPVWAGNNGHYFDWEEGYAESPVFKEWLSKNLPARAEVADAIRWEIYVGYGEDKELPTGPLGLEREITRAEFATALARVLGFEEGSGTPWWEPYASFLKEKDVLEEDLTDLTDEVYWNAPITRLQMGRWMGRAAKAFNASVLPVSPRFSDCSDPDVLYAARVGWHGKYPIWGSGPKYSPPWTEQERDWRVIQGYPDGTFRPDETAQRVHAALMLVRLARSLDDGKPSEQELRNAVQTAVDLYGRGPKNRPYEPSEYHNSGADQVYTWRAWLDQCWDESVYGVSDRRTGEIVSFEVLEAHANVALTRKTVVWRNQTSEHKVTTYNWLVRRGGRWVVGYVGYPA